LLSSSFKNLYYELLRIADLCEFIPPVVSPLRLNWL
jgi:hypothetical protein